MALAAAGPDARAAAGALAGADHLMGWPASRAPLLDRAAFFPLLVVPWRGHSALKRPLSERHATLVTRDRSLANLEPPAHHPRERLAGGGVPMVNRQPQGVDSPDECRTSWRASLSAENW